MDAQDADEDLMLRYGAGDADAFELLYRRHRGPLFRYLLRQCCQQTTADEVFQEVWIKVIQARERYEVRARFRTFLYHIAHHCVVDHFRRQGRLVPVIPAENDTLENLASPGGEQPDEALHHRQMAACLSCLLDALPAEQREVFLLREEAGLEIAEIAAITGTAVEATKSRLRYALRKLREGVKDWL